jgi:predicted transcriptional regulator
MIPQAQPLSVKTERVFRADGSQADATTRLWDFRGFLACDVCPAGQCTKRRIQWGGKPPTGTLAFWQCVTVAEVPPEQHLPPPPDLVEESEAEAPPPPAPARRRPRAKADGDYLTIELSPRLVARMKELARVKGPTNWARVARQAFEEELTALEGVADRALAEAEFRGIDEGDPRMADLFKQAMERAGR